MKEKIRQKILKKRNKLRAAQSKSKKIQKNLFSSEEFRESKTVMFYVSFGSEVYTIGMIKDSLKNKTVCVPVVRGDKMFASEITNINDLDYKNKYGIMEPSKVNKILKNKIDLVIVPGVCFDKSCYRIGYGKGYYDDFLKNFKKVKIGLCFKVQKIGKIPVDKWDIKLDKVISEE